MLPLCAQAQGTDQKSPPFAVEVNTLNEPIAPGPYEPTVESLSNYECPEWFRDVKFGIWAHLGPQCAAEDGDWYARKMYDPSPSAFPHPRPLYSK